jgi:spermidine synthase
MRFLQVNAAREGYQSAWQAQLGLFGRGYYYDYFALPAWWARAGGTWKVLALGAGAGTAFRVLAGASPAGVQLDCTGVEIDSRVVELARTWFEADQVPARWIVGRDARAALRLLPDDFDLLIVDAYRNDLEIPTHLATLEFFREARAHLKPGGWLAINVGGFDAEDPMVVGLGRTLARAFERDVTAVRVPSAMNFVLYARRDAAAPTPEDPAWSIAGAIGDELLPPLGLPGAVVSMRDDPGASVWTDMHSPIELVQQQSLERNREHLRTR